MKIVMVAPFSLTKPRAGDGVRAFALAREFAHFSELTLVSGTPATDAEMTFTGIPLRHLSIGVRRYSKAATVFRSIIFGLPYDSSRFGFDGLSQSLAGESYDLAYLTQPRAWDLWGLLEQPSCRLTVMDLQNDDYDVWNQRCRVKANPLLRLGAGVYRERAGDKMRRLLNAVDIVVCVSEADRISLLNREGHGLLDRLEVVPNGVDASFLRRPTDYRRSPRQLVFVGSLDTRMNKTAVRDLLMTFWPAVRRKVPNSTLLIAGRNPPAWMLKAQGTGVVVIASPPDVRTYLWESTAFVAPFAVGGGTKIKVLEAMAAGTPVIATKAAIQGIPAEAERHYLPAENPQQFAEAFSRLVADDLLVRELTDRASVLAQQFDWSKVAANAYERLIRGVSVRRPRSVEFPALKAKMRRG
jgi:glycosyltransferase involved in cell wall biosynthesis